MKTKFLAVNLLSFFPLLAQCASFDCAKAASIQEKLVCNNGKLSILDDQLSDTYKKALASTIDRDALKKDQIMWLKDVRRKCMDFECLESVYKERLLRLTGSEPEMITAEKAERICQTVTNYINDGTLIDRFEKFLSPTPSEMRKFQEENGTGVYLSGKYVYRNGDDKRVFLDEYFSGSCERGIIQEEAVEGHTSRPLITNIPHNIETDEEIDKEGWGNSEFLLKIDNDLIKIVGNNRTSSFQGKAIYLFNSSGSLQRLCSLGQTGNLKYIIKESLNFNLCEQVVKNRPGINQWRSDLSSAESLFEGGVGPEVMATRADLDDDGKRELIGLLTYQSSAGCGGTIQQVKQLSDDGKSIAPTKLNTNLEQGYGILASWGGYMGSNPNDWWFNAKLIEFDGKSYLLGASKNNSVSICSFWKNERKMWCDYKLLPQHEIVKLYNPEKEDE